MNITITGLALLLSFSLIVFSSQAAFAGNNDLTFTKVANPDTVIQGLGTVVTYTFTTQNGLQDLINCSLVDTKFGTIFSGQTILFGQGRVDVRVIAVSDTETNTATLTCFTDSGTQEQRVDSETVTAITPSVLIVKTASKTQGQVGVDPLQATAGVDIFYAFKVTNTGDIPLTNCVVTDPNLPGLVSNVPTPLAPQAMHTVFSTVAKQYANDFQNTGTVTCADVAMVTPTDSDTADVDIVDPMLTIVKRVDGQLGPISVPDGTFVAYSFKVTNTGDIPLTNCVVSDPLVNLIINNDIPTPLAPQAMHTVFANIYQINAPGPVVNTATVTCDPEAMVTPTDISNTVTVNVLQNPAVMLIKIANPTITQPGETVTYTYDATNNGDVPLTNCNINDDKLGQIGPTNFPLAVGESKPFQASTEIFVDTKNTAKIVCTTGVEPPMVNDTAMATVTIIFVGGEFLPIDSTALMLAGLQTSALWILPAVAGLAGTGYYLIRFRNKE